MVKMTKLAERTAAADVGRPAAACRRRPGTRQPAERAAARRAARRARPQAARGDADRAEAAAEPARHHVRVRHPRPGRGDGHERPHRDHARRPHRAARRSRDRLRTARRRRSSPGSSVATTSGEVRPPAQGMRADDGTVFVSSSPEETRRQWQPALSRQCGPRASHLRRRDPGRRATTWRGTVASVSHYGDTLQYVVRTAEPRHRRAAAAPERAAPGAG